MVEAIAGLNQMFYDQDLFIADDLHDLVAEVEEWEYKTQANGGLADKPKNVDDDFCKCLLYLYQELPTLPKDEYLVEDYKPMPEEPIEWATVYDSEGIDYNTGY